jgi:hypothetical protein
MYRILKLGGELFAYVPFMIPYHAAPDDYYRWTCKGITKLFPCFEAIDIIVGGGPTSGMLYLPEIF